MRKLVSFLMIGLFIWSCSKEQVTPIGLGVHAVAYEYSGTQGDVLKGSLSSLYVPVGGLTPIFRVASSFADLEAGKGTVYTGTEILKGPGNFSLPVTGLTPGGTYIFKSGLLSSDKKEFWSSNSVSFTTTTSGIPDLPAPVIKSISSTRVVSGPSAGTGDEFRVTGENFSPYSLSHNKLLFGTQEINIESATSDLIIARLPSIRPGSYALSVEILGKKAQYKDSVVVLPRLP